LAVRLGDEKGHQRDLGDVELLLAHHALELLRDAALKRLEVEALAVRQELPGDRVLVEQRAQLHRAPGTRRVPRNASSDSPRNAATISGLDTPLARASFSRQKKLAPVSCRAFQSRLRTMSFSSSLRPCIASSGLSKNNFLASERMSECR